MKVISTKDAVGCILCHDITQIIKGVTKDAKFRKGHVVTKEDIPVLLSLGKDNLYVWEKDDTMYHENEAAEILREVCQNVHMEASAVKEGKIELKAQCDGLFRVDVERLNAINDIDQVMIATRHTNTPVKAGDKSGWVSGDYVIAETSYSYGETKEEEEKRIAEEEAQEKMAASVVCGADGRPGTRPVGAVSQGRVNTPSQAPGTPGQAVIDYACQFIGNPYVWGGTSLTNGADCSGFVQSVYAHFGVSLPRTTYDMVNSGYAVSYEEALPGDLILYDGHVGLYMGDGTIVNAMNEADGIGICSATYTDIIAVRRVL